MKRDLAFLAPPLLALVAVVVWRCAPPNPTEPAERGQRVRVDAPPTAECAKALEESLGRVKAGCEAVAVLQPALGIARAADRGSGHADAGDWPTLDSRPSFIERFLEGPPGLPVAMLHRCSDLNPEDVPIAMALRRSIEAAVQPYFDAILDLQKRTNEMMDREFLAAESRGLCKTSVVPLGPDGSIGGTLEASSEPSVNQLRVGKDRKQVSVSVSLQHMPQYRYYEGLQWYAVREAGVQIVGIYSAMGFIPSNVADAMCLEIVRSCNKLVD